MLSPSKTLIGGKEGKHASVIACAKQKGKLFFILVKSPGNWSEWKFPGGRVENGENIKQAAKREFAEETGKENVVEDLKFFRKEKNKEIFFFFFYVFFHSFRSFRKDLKERGDEGEEVKIFSIDEMKSMQGFFQPHREVFLRFLKEECHGEGLNKNGIPVLA